MYVAGLNLIMRRHLLAVSSLSIALVALATEVHAGGLEYAGGGTIGLGRGGANAARADSPFVLSNNPAGLAELRGMQSMINFQYARLNACVTPYGYYGWGGASFEGSGGYGTA